MSSNPAEPPTWRAWKARNGGKSWDLRAPLAVEWALEWFVYRLRSLALFDLLELAGRCTVLVFAIFWMLEADNRAKERHYRAWDLINSAQGSPGDGGRRDALQDLNDDGVDLAGVQLEGAWLPYIDLPGADLYRANLQFAVLKSPNLKGAAIREANLKGAHLLFCNLERAQLGDAILQGAIFETCNMVGADLRGFYTEKATRTQGAYIFDVESADVPWKGTSFFYSNLAGADLRDTNLKGVSFKYANLRAAKLHGANLEEVQRDGLAQAQLDAADGDDDTVLPQGLTRPAHWLKAERPESPPLAQPDDTEPAPTADSAPGSEK